MPRLEHPGIAMSILLAGLWWGAGVCAARDPLGPDQYNVVWNSPSAKAIDSMPIGNGDVALNVWVEPRPEDAKHADLLFYIAKSDAVSENSQLLKLGRVRVSFNPNPFIEGAPFRQELRLGDGEILVSAGAGNAAKSVRVWVHADEGEIYVEASGAEPFTMRAKTELWRTAPRTVPMDSKELGDGMCELNGCPTPVVVDPDIVLDARDNQLIWLHRNERSLYPSTLAVQRLAQFADKYPDPLLHRTFGCLMRGPDLTAIDNLTLQSAKPAMQQRLAIAVHLAQTPSIDAWREQLKAHAIADDKVPLEDARAHHRRRWQGFWNRSWIDVSGPRGADKVASGYALQRWMEACAGRGQLPMKFNGSLFTVGASLPDPTDGGKLVDRPDWRNWGSMYWFQNTRHLYWPLLASGDFDVLVPWFRMYARALPLAKEKTRQQFQHGGAYFPEVMLFWGLPSNKVYDWNNAGVEVHPGVCRYYWQGGIEMAAMMLDQYDYWADPHFAAETLVPFTDAIVTFYDEHWKRNAEDRIQFEPAQALEMYLEAVNPMPEIAGLRFILPRMLALPDNLTTAEQRQRWAKMLKDLPPVPIRAAPDGMPALQAAEKFDPINVNMENPELYCVFPYRLYGVGKPDLELARHTYAVRRFKNSGCWHQDALDAALLGLPADASRDVAKNFTMTGARFQAFWTPSADWIPDMDNGGVGMAALQRMVLQCEGRQIVLLPAWPKDWDVDFKLRAPLDTTVQGVVQGGQLTKLLVDPESRRADVVMAEGWGNPGQ